jgi:Ras family
MFRQPELREVLREQAEILARENSLAFIDECSAKTGQQVFETFMEVVETIYAVQMELVKTGQTTIERLKLKDTDTSMEF